MKLAVLVCLVAVAAAASRHPQQYQPYQTTTPKYGTTAPTYGTTQKYYQPEIKLLNSYSKSDSNGNYEYGYEQDNGQKVQEVGTSNPGHEPGYGSISKTGSFEYTSPDGQQHHIDYTAGVGGYQPRGQDLPHPPAQLIEYQQHREQFPELYESHPVPTYDSYGNLVPVFRGDTLKTKIPELF